MQSLNKDSVRDASEVEVRLDLAKLEKKLKNVEGFMLTCIRKNREAVKVFDCVLKKTKMTLKLLIGKVLHLSVSENMTKPLFVTIVCCESVPKRFISFSTNGFFWRNSVDLKKP